MQLHNFLLLWKHNRMQRDDLFFLCIIILVFGVEEKTF